MRIDEKLIEQIRNEATPSFIIGKYISLEKRGNSFISVCPFHDDHSPSMHISDEKGIYKCFACQSGGNVFTFVQNFKKVSFLEAVKQVGEHIGIHIDIDKSIKSQKVNPKQKYFNILNDMIDYGKYILKSNVNGQKALDYLYLRQIDEKLIEQFKIGYIDSNLNHKRLFDKGYTKKQLQDVGVILSDENGDRDVFLNRIIFPIFDIDSNPVGFTGRDIDNLNQQKYINTSNNKIYLKSDVVYNLNFFKNNFRKNDPLILVEGTMDVIAYAKSNILNVAASLGTSLTLNQIKSIKQLTNNIILSYDGDKAGQAANLKAISLLLENNLKIDVIKIPKDLDPDDVVMKFSNNKLKELLANKVSCIQYVFDYYRDIYNLNNFEDKKKYNQECINLINKLQDINEKKHYIEILNKYTGFNNKLSNSNTFTKDLKNTKMIKISKGIEIAEMYVLYQMGKNKEQYKKIINKDPQFIGLAKTVFSLINKAYSLYDQFKFDMLLNDIDDKNLQNYITDIIDNYYQNYDDKILDDCLRKIEKENLITKRNKIKSEILSDGLTQQENDNKIIQYQQINKSITKRS